MLGGSMVWWMTKNVGELSRIIRFDPQEMSKALRYLLQQQHIQLSTAEGKVIEDISFLPPTP
jgi:hypothetical protein